MGAPSSAVLFEFLSTIYGIFTYRCFILKKKLPIIDYFRYVDDILPIYDSTQSSAPSILTDFNSILPSLHFVAETETDNTVNPYLANVENMVSS